MPTNKNEIKLYMHCALCLTELPSGSSPQSFGSLEAGWTPDGLQVWCKRHDVNVINIDFEGQQHPANTTRENK